jgi:abhydrolase domain-containing protein 6
VLRPRTLDVAARRVHRSGRSAATVLLLHGLFGKKEHCYEFGSYLAPRFHVVIPDLSGFGDNVGYPKSAYRFASMIDLLEEFVRLLAIEGFHVAGNSMGASLAGVMAARFPPEVLSLAFLGPPSITCPKMSDVERLALEGINISVPRTLEQFHQKIDHLFYVKPRVLSDRLDEIGRDEIANYESHIEVFNIVQKDDLILDRYIQQVTASPLIIWGDRDRFMALQNSR